MHALQSTLLAPRRPAGHVNGLPVTVRANLPRVWERVEGALAEPIRPTVSHEHPLRIGARRSGGASKPRTCMHFGPLSCPLARWLAPAAALPRRSGRGHTATHS
jgi:hypothetical protein